MDLTSTNSLLFGLLLVAVALGYLMGQWRASKRLSVIARKSSRFTKQRYLEGLNQLLKEQQDAAIDTFVTNLEVNSDTLETHFALGGLLRKRGEVDRAIRIHQNLLARPSLNAQQQEQAQMALALDYRKSGLLDRAEALFEDLAQSSDDRVRIVSLENLVQIFQEEQEWEQALACAEQLGLRKNRGDAAYWRHLQGHFCCELAVQSKALQSHQCAAQWTRKSLAYEADGVRPALMMSQLELAQQKPEDALRWLKSIQLRARYPALILEAAEQCFAALGQQEELLPFVETIYRRNGNVELIPVLTELIGKHRSGDAAMTFLNAELKHHPSFEAIARMLELTNDCHIAYHDVIPVLQHQLPPTFHCDNCGFEGHFHYWCCPTCKTWV